MTDPVTPAAPVTPVTPSADPAIVTPPTGGEPAVVVTPPATPPVTGTVLEVKPPEGGDPLAEGWGADWRQKYAGDDEKMLKRLERYASPKAAIDALVEAQKKISAGEVTKPLPKDPTPEQLAEFRKASGIPETAAGYFEKMPDGLVLGEEDKAIFESFAERMHAQNVPPAVMHDVVRWYNDFVDQQATTMAETEATTRAAAEDTLRQEWGADYRVNLNIVNALLNSAPEGVKESLFSARLPDGKPLGNDATILRWLAQTARELNPAATLVPGTSGSPMAGVEQRISEIEKAMRTNRREYLRDDKMQAEYRNLLSARERLAKAS
jgi:hypothetical protein